MKNIVYLIRGDNFPPISSSKNCLRKIARQNKIIESNSNLRFRTGLRFQRTRKSVWQWPRTEPRRLRSRGTHQGSLTELHTPAGAHRQARLRRHDALTMAVATTWSRSRSLTPLHRPRLQPRRCPARSRGLVATMTYSAHRAAADVGRRSHG